MHGPDWERQLEGYDGILVPGGFGKRGIDGMLNAIRYAREHKVPYLRHLPRHADDGDRIRAQRVRAWTTPIPPSSTRARRIA